MTLRLPLVQNGGQIEQLQSGDTLLAPMATADTRQVINGESSTTLVVGMSVYLSAAGTVKRAQANAISTGAIFGLVYDVSIAAAASGNICVGGVMTATTAQWDAVAGTSGGLTFNTLYFVDPANLGKITATAPSTVGQVVQPVGRAINSTDMEIILGPNILL